MIKRLAVIHYLKIFYLALLLLLCPLAGQAQPRMLVLGDSHMVGQFGERFHVKMHEWKKFEILSVSIGGSGSANFLHQLTNFCCGFMVRHAKPGDSLDKHGKFPWQAGSYVITNERILEQYKSRLDTILKQYKPHVIVIELGSNLVNAHQQLLRLIHTHAPNAAVYWIGSYARAMGDYRLHEIEKVCFPLYNRCMLVRCDDVVGSKTLLTYHFTGEDATRWADSVANRVGRLYNQHWKHAMHFNISEAYTLAAARLTNPLMYCFYRKIVRYCPGEGWLANALLQKQPAEIPTIVK